jgi:hypothetical protein
MYAEGICEQSAEEKLGGNRMINHHKFIIHTNRIYPILLE